MKKIITLTLSSVMAFSAVAQTSSDSQTFTRTDAQKGVGISSDVLAVALPVTALGASIIMKDWQGVKQAAFTGAATVGASLILKYAVKKERPDHSNLHSFPSAHTSISFASAAYIQRRYGWKFGAPAYAVATYVGWARIYAKKHDIWDVLAGAAIGAGSAYIFTRPFAQKHNLQITPVTDGQTFAVTASFTF